MRSQVRLLPSRRVESNIFESHGTVLRLCRETASSERFPGCWSEPWPELPLPLLKGSPQTSQTTARNRDTRLPRDQCFSSSCRHSSQPPPATQLSTRRATLGRSKHLPDGGPETALPGEETGEQRAEVEVRAGHDASVQVHVV